MSDSKDLNIGEKLQALWNRFAHEVSEDGGVAIPIQALPVERDFYVHIKKDEAAGVFQVSLKSEKDGRHDGFFTGPGFPKAGVSFNAKTGIYSENTAWISAKLGDDFAKLGVKDEEGARQIGMFIERHINNAYDRHIGMPS